MGLILFLVSVQFWPTQVTRFKLSTEAAGGIGEVINAQSVGLVCDGVTDNASALATIAARTKKAGQAVFFPPAVRPCLTSAPVKASSGTIYTAYPGTVTLAPTSNSNANPLLFSAAGVSDVKVYGLGFDGGLASAQNNAANVGVVYRSARVEFEQIYVHDTRGIALLFSTEVKASGVRASRFFNVGNFWKSSGNNKDQQQAVVYCCGSGNTGNFILDSSFQSSGLDAVSATNQSNFQVSGNRFFSVGGRHSNGGAAIYGSENMGLVVVGNVIDGVAGNGIDLYKSSNQTVTGNYVRAAGGSGISLSTIAVGAVTGNTVVDSNQSNGQSLLNSGLSLSGGNSGLTLAANTSTDDQLRKTQKFGIQGLYGMTCKPCTIDSSNEIGGNAISAFGGSVTGFSSKLGATIGWGIPTGAGPKLGVALPATGTGGIQTGAHDGSSDGENVIGGNSIDFCPDRQNAELAASGRNAACVYGSNNLVAGRYSSAGGLWNRANGRGSRVWGQFADDRRRAGADIWSSGYNSTLGDAQLGHYVLRALTKRVVSRRLTTDGSATPNAQDCVNLPTGNMASVPGLYGLSVRLVAIDITHPDNILHWYQPQYTIYTTGITSAMTLNAAKPVVQSNGRVGTVEISADRTNSCLSVIWTAPNDDTWHVVARVDDIEAF